MDLLIDKDLENHTLTVTATFDHPRDRVWDLYADPRKLERIWGPPTYPATVVEHDLSPGGVMRYFMTSPEGEQHHGLWRISAVEPGESFAADDYFADADGNPVADLPATHFVFTFSESDGRTTMVTVSSYDSREALEQVLAMGMEEGLTAAMGQIDGVLGDA
ncbi:SRPBCC family protein [Aeromicrobium sp. CF3.5]|uniref:SRPBCC family protein n=1 Tax=Aeromicrobium sp. CF3.5 TaxID=3373078 RepID=UPI003EE62120